MNTSSPTVPLPSPFDPGISPSQAAFQQYEIMRTRRTVRSFSTRSIHQKTVEWIVRTAGTAPSGANKQPWTFVAISDPNLKSRIRLATEKEEKLFYQERATEEWLQDLSPLGTDFCKAYMEQAPWLIVLFRQTRGEDGGAVYYARESVGIALGFLLSAAHQAGLATMVHTPNPMRFLGQLLGRPETEQAVAVIPIGFPHPDCRVPLAALQKKQMDEILVVNPGSGDSSRPFE
ncbi:MAG: nitroreductase family protein [Planctomycetota bacterium]|jgi:nitroreductase|nr:nitroreductase family protein [Planctomycetota bacterium]